MEAFQALLEIANTLHGPNGCPWDKEQTLCSLRPHLLEELHEVLEAIDEDDSEKMVEELGDLLFLIVFCAKLGQTSKRFTIDQILTQSAQKLIRRHPHVFGKERAENAAEAIDYWERSKRGEQTERKNALEGIPSTLNALARAQKIIDKMVQRKIPFPTPPVPTSPVSVSPVSASSVLTSSVLTSSVLTSSVLTSSEKKSPDEIMGEALLDLVMQAHQEGIDAESALRCALKRFETVLKQTL